MMVAKKSCKLSEIAVDHPQEKGSGDHHIFQYFSVFHVIFCLSAADTAAILTMSSEENVMNHVGE